MTIIHITDLEEFNKQVIDSEQTVLVDFYAEWCGPCKSLSPILEEFSGSNGDVKVVKIDVDKGGEIAGKYGVMSIPSLKVFKGGKVVIEEAGVKTIAELTEMTAN
jgi:thioredoxin 1